MGTIRPEPSPLQGLLWTELEDPAGGSFPRLLEAGSDSCSLLPAVLGSPESSASPRLQHPDSRVNPTQRHPRVPFVPVASLLSKPWLWFSPATNQTEPVRRVCRQPGGVGLPEVTAVSEPAQPLSTFSVQNSLTQTWIITFR